MVFSLSTHQKSSCVLKPSAINFFRKLNGLLMRYKNIPTLYIQFHLFSTGVHRMLSIMGIGVKTANCDLKLDLFKTYINYRHLPVYTFNLQMSTTPGIPRRSPIQVLTCLNVV